jgi:3D-(3,5/4)-trihydroxycyclohexane-1,2-dione acylhydrolase (decyclizing)
VDFAAHAAALGCAVYTVDDRTGLADAYRAARTAATDRPAVVVVRTDPAAWTEAGAWWEVGLPETSERQEIQFARDEHEQAKSQQVRYLNGPASTDNEP